MPGTYHNMFNSLDVSGSRVLSFTTFRLYKKNKKKAPQIPGTYHNMFNSLDLSRSRVLSFFTLRLHTEQLTMIPKKRKPHARTTCYIVS